MDATCGVLFPPNAGVSRRWTGFLREGWLGKGAVCHWQGKAEGKENMA